MSGVPGRCAKALDRIESERWLEARADRRSAHLSKGVSMSEHSGLTSSKFHGPTAKRNGSRAVPLAMPWAPPKTRVWFIFSAGCWTMVYSMRH